MIESSCHCGAVKLDVATEPEAVTDCNCSICRRYGVLWAYYSPRDVRVLGATEIYMWNGRSIEFHRCRTCGCVTHWAPVDETHDRMGINARLMAPEILRRAAIRRHDGAGTGEYTDR